MVAGGFLWSAVVVDAVAVNASRSPVFLALRIIKTNKPHRKSERVRLHALLFCLYSVFFLCYSVSATMTLTEQSGFFVTHATRVRTRKTEAHTTPPEP